MSERKEDLLQQSLTYFLENGLADLSLRPLADHVGTSARMLLYHFGSKEGLIKEVMDEVRFQFQTSFTKIMDSRGKTKDEPPILTFWESLARPCNLPHIRLLFELQILSLQNPSQYLRYQEHAITSWLDLIEKSIPPSKGRRAMATLCAAVFDGLLLELLTTGDRRRTTEALHLFIDQLRRDPLMTAPTP
jgi:AcrR family transcriptional regulator